MAFENNKTTNNAESLLTAWISASATSCIVTTGEGALYPSTFPFKLIHEAFNTSWIVTKRSISKCTWRSGDILTIVRNVETCVQDETVSPKVLWNIGLSFVSWDKISLYNTAGDSEDIKAEIARLETDKLDITTYNAEKNIFWASTEWDDDYQITDTNTTTYVNWRTYRIQCDVANTWVATLEINALWTKALKKNQGTEDLVTGDILANWIITAVYNSTLDVFQFSGQEATVLSGWAMDLLITSESSSAVANVDFLDLWQYSDYSSFKIVGYTECVNNWAIMQLSATASATFWTLLTWRYNWRQMVHWNTASSWFTGTATASKINNWQHNWVNSWMSFILDMPQWNIAVGNGGINQSPQIMFETNSLFSADPLFLTKEYWNLFFEWSDYRSLRLNFSSWDIRKHRIQLYWIK